MVTRCNPQVAVINRDPVAGSGTIKGGIGGAPVLMGASLSLSPGDAGVSLDMKAMQPLKEAAYFIDEIRIGAVGSSDSITSFLAGGIGGAVSAQFSTGKYGMSKEPIPISLYGARHSGGYDYGIDQNGSADINSYVSIRWLLPKPLFMLPGEVLQCRLSRSATLMSAGTAPSTVTVWVAYAGRMVAPGATPPKTIQVPWVSYIQKVSNESLKSSITEFRNPFTKTMHVQRFTIRNYKTNDSAAAETLFETSEGLFQGAPGNEQFDRLRLDDSLGYKIVGGAFVSSGNVTDSDPAIGACFDYPRRSWTFSRELGAREQFNMNILRLNPDAGTNLKYLQVGMIGYREENV